MNETILIVDDEKEITDLVEIYLKNDGYQVCKCSSGKEALAGIETQKIDLAILDIMLPDIDGFSLCKKIREAYYFPIIMLTAKVVTRVKSQLRRYRWYNTKEDKESEEFHIRGLDIWKDRHLCTLNGKDLELTPMEFDIVWLLCENANKVVDTEQLFETVWKEKYLENNNNTVMAHVARIREKMHEVPRKPKYIKTVWGVGYKIDE